MSVLGLDSKFQNLIDSSFDLVAEYNAIESNIPLEYAYEDILEAYNAYKNVNKNADFTSTIRPALSNAIKYEQNIVDSILSMTSDALQDNPSN